MFVHARIFFQVSAGELEERGGGAQAVFLQMHERTCELDESLVKISVRAMLVRQPQIFQHVVRLVKKLAVEAVEIAEVMRGEFVSPEGFDHRGDAGAFVTHRFRVKSKVQSPKSKVAGLVLTLDIGLETLDFICHSARMAKPALGRGLGALLGGNPPLPQSAPAPSVQPAVAIVAPPAPDNRERVLRVPLHRVRPSALQPRKEFSEDSLRELADSIREQGIVQPLIVRERNGFFELIAGERRWRAAQLLNLPEVPVITREADDRAVLELALIENLQRENLNAIEEAHGYAQLAEQFQLTQEEIALKVGKSRAVVANATRLLRLPDAVQKFVREGRLSVGHAKVILGLADEKSQRLTAERVIKEGLNVRQTEGLIAKLQKRGQKISSDGAKPLVIVPVDSNIARLEEKLREKFGTKVQLKYAQGKGAVEISFFSDDELQRVLEILDVNAD
jgi:ParB family chromosome partitioning protein